ncbi:nitric oxide-associated protein 1-like [Lytechinus pictus]|uniref:nitric oxide-associated protein 1-like n=1 Tax=Lytechinus pictus TaxID=7653 RepID=UPI0030BA0C9E
MANNMLNYRFLQVVRVPCVHRMIKSSSSFLPEVLGNQTGCSVVRCMLIRLKHGSGRGSRRGQLSKIGKHRTPGPRPSTTTEIVTDDVAASGTERVTHEIDNQYFGGILDRHFSEGDLQRVPSGDSVSKMTPAEDLNEFDSQYFQELGKKDVSHNDIGHKRSRIPTAVSKSRKPTPGRTIRGHFMFNEIDLKYFDDISSSFVYENTERNSTSDPTDFNEFDQQYFRREHEHESNQATKASSETPMPAKRYMDTSLSEEEMYKQHLSRRTQIRKGEEEELEKWKSKSFKVHDRPTQYQDISKDEFADHREVHLITNSSIDEVLLDSIPPDLKGKLLANRQWEEQKEELRVSHHNVEDLEESVVSALKAVKKKRNKKQKPRRSRDMKVFGSEDKGIPVSEVPCSGCGAFLQCQDNSRPGFVPSEKFTELDLSKPVSNSVCQRCWYIIHRHTALNVSVPQDSYSDIIKAVRKNRSALVILMVDLLDFPCSIIKNLKDLIGSSRPIVIVGNKLDVLPKDEPKQERRLKDHLMTSCVEMGVCDADRVKHVELISAKSGYGVENLITKILSLKPKKGDVYLLGTANVGKSTLFNRFLESDLCKSKASALMGRATISQWPGTTLNLLRFPLLNPSKERMAQRMIRLKKNAKEVKIKKKEEETDRLRSKLDAEDPQLVSYVEGNVGQTFKPKSHDDEENEGEETLLPEERDPFGMTLGVPPPARAVSKKQEVKVPFSPLEFAESQWFYDTPGVLYQEQVLTKLSSEELKLVVPKKCIQPRSLVLKPGQTFFLGGLGRLDYLQGKESAFFTVFSSQALPIKVVDTQDADAVYAEKAGFKTFVVPIGGHERMENFPSLVPTDFTLTGIGRHMSVADILFSSAGWAAVTCNQGMAVHLRAFTPGGLGCILRTPALLPYGFSLKGTRRSRNSPFYNVNKQKLLMYMR